jgi:hypothetical protein
MQLFLSMPQICQLFLISSKKCRNNMYLILFLMRIPEWGSAILYLKSYSEKKEKNTFFVRFSDYYLNIPLWSNSFLISLYFHSYALNFSIPNQHLDLALPSISH